MMRRALLALCVARLCLGGGNADAKDEKLPNFVLIFIDDQGYQDIGCFGSPNIRTPRLDRMAKEGMRFTDFYALAPVCSASRAALLTASYPPRVGITGVLFPRAKIGLNPDEITIAERLKPKGYTTAAVGKWHLGHLPQFLPTRQGFDSYFGIPYSNDMDRVKAPGKGVKGLDRAYDEDDSSFWNVPLLENEKIIERPAKQVDLTKRYTDKAIEFVQKSKDKPFFLYLAHTMPHIPLFATSKFKKQSKAGPYGDTIEELDANVGRLLDAIDDAGLKENTLVVYTSDNGPWLSMKHHGGSALPLRGGKFSTHEGGMRVPTIMRWPGHVPAGSVCSEVAASFDLGPTFAKLAGAPEVTDRPLDGKDISALLLGKTGAKSPHDAFLYYKGGRLEAVRSGKYKLRLRDGKKRGKKPKGDAKKPAPKNGGGLLYDLSKDISETTNIADAHPEVVARLRAAAETYDKSLQASKRPAGKAK
ncbi:MAG: sulfatase [Planctomycetota bacterium]